VAKIENNYSEGLNQLVQIFHCLIFCYFWSYPMLQLRCDWCWMLSCNL